ncbi:MAG: hypothetical protein V1774_07050 [Candidatus Eisenbacteria bacterium]
MIRLRRRSAERGYPPHGARSLGFVAIILGTTLSAQAAPLGWSDELRVTTSDYASANPTIAADPEGDLLVAWDEELPADLEVFARSRTGGTWGDEFQLTAG